jgi:hypothetical protein
MEGLSTSYALITINFESLGVEHFIKVPRASLN